MALCLVELMLNYSHLGTTRTMQLQIEMFSLDIF